MVRPSPSAPPTTSLCNFPQEDEVLANCPSLTPRTHDLCCFLGISGFTLQDIMIYIKAAKDFIKQESLVIKLKPSCPCPARSLHQTHHIPAHRCHLCSRCGHCRQTTEARSDSWSCRKTQSGCHIDMLVPLCKSPQHHY